MNDETIIMILLVMVLVAFTLAVISAIRELVHGKENIL